MPQSLRKFLMLQSNWNPLSLYFPLSGNISPFTQISFDSGTGWWFTSCSQFQAYLPLFHSARWGLGFSKPQSPASLASWLSVKHQEMGHPRGLECGRQRIPSCSGSCICHFCKRRTAETELLSAVLKFGFLWYLLCALSVFQYLYYQFPILNPLHLPAWTLADTGLDTGRGLRKWALKNKMLRLICFELKAELFANGKWERVIYGMQWHCDSLHYPQFSLGWSVGRRWGFGDPLTAAWCW